ncbi:MAG: leucine-rich repeat domain-containing protein [Corallococcus sp.]|nr:leucine-rich repeat domain-containing protein [Bacillota bacterium]MCM1533177.1 leucine-rich repeat domain-containing protein [Corallococcus sp.]
MKKSRIILLLVLFALATVSAAALAACEIYDPKHTIDGINANAVLHIEHNDDLVFARNMTIDPVEIIVKCGCSLTDDEGNEVAITEKHLRDGAVTYENFDLSTSGLNKQIKIAYKETDNYIIYDVIDYTAEFYLDKEQTVLWKTVSASASFSDDLSLSVWVDMSANNYSVDETAMRNDSERALRFNGWYMANKNEPTTGIVSMAKVSGNLEKKLKFSADFLSVSDFNKLSIRYDANRRVFEGYTGEATDEVVVPEGVTYVDLAKVFSNVSDANPVKFKKLRLPSTARMALSSSNALNTYGLEEITVDSGSEWYSSFNSGLYSKDYSRLYLMPASSLQVTFHEDLNVIDSYSCAYWNIVALDIPDSVTTLNNYCFYYSTLSSVTGCKGIVSINSGVFVGTSLSDSDGHALYVSMPNAGGSNKYNLNLVVDRKMTSYTVKEGTVSIDGDAFNGCDKLVSVDLGDELESIGESAFSGCSSLKSVTLPASLKQLASSVFYECTSLESVEGLGDITFSDGGRRLALEHAIPSYLFYNCESLNNVVLSDSITYIGSSAFSGCINLTNFSIPDGVETISASAFKSCGFTEITLPSSLVTMGNNAFFKSKITSIDLSVCPNLSELSTRCFQETSLETLTIPDNITDIPDYCFYYITTLTSVDLNKVTEIGERAFGQCTHLADVTWSEVLTDIGFSAFRSCGTSAKNSDNQTVYYGLENVVLPDSVINVGGYAFASCANLTSLHLGPNVVTFGNYPFDDDDPEEFGVIEPVLYATRKLTTITVAENNVNFKIIDGMLFGKKAGNKTYDDFAVLYAVPSAYDSTSVVLPEETRITLPYSAHNLTKVTSFTLNDGIENLGKATFYNSTKLTAMTIPASVTKIGSNILLSCTGIKTFSIDAENETYEYSGDLVYQGESLVLSMGLVKEVAIPDGTKEIGSASFMNNNVITSVVIPDSVESIGAKAFNSCSKLASISIGRGVKTIDTTAFSTLKVLETISVSADNPYFKVVNNVLYSKDGKKLYLAAAKNGLVDLDILEDVTEIGDWAFAYHATLTNIRLPENVKTIGKYAFYECRKLETFYGSESLEKIGERAFSFANSIDTSDSQETRCCAVLKTVLLYDKMTTIESYAFYGQYGIESVFFKMTEDELNALLAGGAHSVNIEYLTHGCPVGTTGKYYNNDKEGIDRYLYSEEETELPPPDGYKWFFIDEDGNPVSWESITSEEEE